MLPSQPLQPFNVKLKNQHIGLGAIFVIAGCILFVASVITLIFSDGFVNYKTGIWMGIFAIIAGLLAVFAVKLDNKHLLMGSLAMDVVCAFLSCVVLVLVSIEYTDRSESKINKILEGMGEDPRLANQLLVHINNGTSAFSIVGMRITMLYDELVVLGMLVAFVTFIVHASMCCFDMCECCAICCACCSCCCRQPRPPGGIITSQPQMITIQTGGVPASGVPMQVMPGQVMPGQVMPGQVMPGQVMPGQFNNPYPNYQYSQVPIPTTASQPPVGSYPVQQSGVNPDDSMSTEKDGPPSDAMPPPSYDDASK